jgi:hypothetical protein
MRCCQRRWGADAGPSPGVAVQLPGDTDATRSEMTRRSRLLLATTALALLVIAGSLHWASHPQRLTGALLDRIGASLGLEITASGTSEYMLRGDPRLVVRDLVARQPGAQEPILRASRVELSLPWSTIRARGAVLEAIRLELDDPQLDLQALQRWQATRAPTGAPRIPTLTKGLTIQRGRLVGSGWSLEAVSIELPALHPEHPVRADVEGRVHAGAIRIPFDLALGLSKPAADAAADAHGTVEIRASGWQLPMRLHASGQLRLDAQPSRIDALKLGADARYVGAEYEAPFVLGLAGSLRFADGVTLAPAGIALRSEDAIPTLDAGGRIEWRDELALHLEGALAQWPDAWPALPAPIGRPRTPVRFDLAYAGAPDFSGPASLQTRHGETLVDANFHLPDVLAWIGADATGIPLPPIEGRLQTPRLEIAGAMLEGVNIEIENYDAGEPSESNPEADRER